ncbi:hypothetical protein EG832_20170 [bacterium]|nr:hypothetical protein [bacterium]
MKKLSFIIAALFISGTVYSQGKFLESNKIYPDAKVYQKGSSMMRVKDLVLINDTVLQFSYSDMSGPGSLKQIPAKNIRYIGIKKGNHAASYGAYGAGVGLLSAIYGVLNVKSDPYLDDSDVNWTPFIVGFTAGGGALGAIVGLCVPKWEMLYLPPATSAFSIEITPDIGRNFYGLGVKVKF